MFEEIKRELLNLEIRHDIEIPFAIESGSRADRFAAMSPRIVMRSNELSKARKNYRSRFRRRGFDANDFLKSLGR